MCVLVSGRRTCWRSRSAGRKAVGRAGSRIPSQGSGQRGWNLSLGRWGEESSRWGGHCPGGGRVGRLFSASNNTAPGSHCHGVKGPNGGGGGGGSQGWGGNSEQWSVGERSPWVRRGAGWWVGEGGGGFYTVVFLFFVDSSSRTEFLWSSETYEVL